MRAQDPRTRNPRPQNSRLQDSGLQNLGPWDFELFYWNLKKTLKSKKSLTGKHDKAKHPFTYFNFNCFSRVKVCFWDFEQDFCKTLENAFLLMSNCNRKSKWYIITGTKLMFLFLGEWKWNFLSAVASANTISKTIDIKQLAQLNSIFSLMLFMSWKLHT